MAAAAADWKLSDAITARLDAEYVYKDITETPALQLLPAAQGFVPDIPDPTLNFGGRDLRYGAFAANVLGRVDWRLSRQWALTVEAGQAVTERDYRAALSHALGASALAQAAANSAVEGRVTARLAAEKAIAEVAAAVAQVQTRLAAPEARRVPAAARRTAQQVVAATTAQLLREGRMPLYRHQHSNVGSAAVGRAVGFEPALTLSFHRLG